MIKTVRKISTIKDIYRLDLDVFQLTPSLKIDSFEQEAEFLTGAYYNQFTYPMVALFISDINGNILSDVPFIHEDGIPTYRELFQRFNYTLI